MESFHKSFLNILQNKDPLQNCETKQKTITYFTINNSEDIIKLAPQLISGVKRDQNLIKTRDDYYVARDSLTNTVYICFKHLLTIDIDTEIDINDVLQHFSKIPETFRIYKSKRGFHVYCTSRNFDYRSKDSVDFMFNNMCDAYYCVYSYIRGYCTRLNNKFNDCDQDIYQYLGKTGDKPELDRLVKLTNLMSQLSSIYKGDININK